VIFSLIWKAISPFAMYAVIGSFILGAGVWAKHDYDASIISGIAGKQAALALTEERANNAATISALQQRAKYAEAEAARYASIKGQIANAKSSTACASSPALRAALDGLRGNSGGHH
jgi:hypothetical protein